MDLHDRHHRLRRRLAAPRLRRASLHRARTSRRLATTLALDAAAALAGHAAPAAAAACDPCDGGARARGRPRRRRDLLPAPRHGGCHVRRRGGRDDCDAPPDHRRPVLRAHGRVPPLRRPGHERRHLHRWLLDKRGAVRHADDVRRDGRQVRAPRPHAVRAVVPQHGLLLQPPPRLHQAAVRRTAATAAIAKIPTATNCTITKATIDDAVVAPDATTASQHARFGSHLSRELQRAGGQRARRRPLGNLRPTALASSLASRAHLRAHTLRAQHALSGVARGQQLLFCP
mmetsp:Transcript_14614/g.43507  ORF Transcript_14614/g.43507 Transcript_14614/m.43507 type:complete len:287 (-) Transcript_14614:527-1387(-)